MIEVVKNLLVFLSLSDDERSYILSDLSSFPALPNDIGSKNITEIEKNALFCLALGIVEDYSSIVTGQIEVARFVWTAKPDSISGFEPVV